MKRIEKSNYRIVVEPRVLGDFGSIRTSDSYFYETQEKREKAYEARCKDIKDQIKRHVDDVRSIEVEYDTQVFCSHCNLSWEEDEEGAPICCDKAVEEYEKSKVSQ